MPSINLLPESVEFAALLFNCWRVKSRCLFWIQKCSQEWNWMSVLNTGVSSDAMTMELFETWHKLFRLLLEYSPPDLRLGLAACPWAVNEKTTSWLHVLNWAHNYCIWCYSYRSSSSRQCSWSLKSLAKGVFSFVAVRWCAWCSKCQKFRLQLEIRMVPSNGVVHHEYRQHHSFLRVGLT